METAKAILFPSPCAFSFFLFPFSFFLFPFSFFLFPFSFFFMCFSFLFCLLSLFFPFLSSIVQFSTMIFDCLINLVGSTSSLASPSTSLLRFLSFLSFSFLFDLPILFAVSCSRCDSCLSSFSFPLFCRRYLTKSFLDFVLF
ncbi:hypothetical protein BDV30DRAFT_67751 [Aspergillus minisclerotigenes]|uniref:Uncharacterized protein n=1 Tax=Aspergillus minisclerotigenes TaxID=656917 RepID=A0A5N6IJJ7_9EURO|nr:hypothetical protein BDV30DRAFT_67751 [Aspergillus minisclerotigenes]